MTRQVSFLKFHPLCYLHVFIFGMLLAALRDRLEQRNSVSQDHLGDGDGCHSPWLNSGKPATDAADECAGRTAAARLCSLARHVSQYGACVGYVHAMPCSASPLCDFITRSATLVRASRVAYQGCLPEP